MDGWRMEPVTKRPEFLIEHLQIHLISNALVTANRRPRRSS